MLLEVFFQLLVIKTLDPDPQLEKMLNPEPQLCWQISFINRKHAELDE
jgi:hypothetical protein